MNVAPPVEAHLLEISEITLSKGAKCGTNVGTEAHTFHAWYMLPSSDWLIL